ncbi:MAG TPA: hypothetical protein VFB76_19755 [Candidatus Angelobacter sp.]|nr:hypothetical protein [Candidatus Angelobacter sp.]
MDQVKKTPAALVLLAWLFVGVPWGWGVVELWKNAKKLFVAPPAATAPASPAPAAPAPAATAPSSK